MIGAWPSISSSSYTRQPFVSLRKAKVRLFALTGWEPVLSTWTPMLGADPAKKRFT